MKIEALMQQVLMEEVERKSRGGIVLPSELTDMLTTGKIVSVGPKVEYLKVGDTVMYEKSYAVAVNTGEENYFLIEEENVVIRIIQEEKGK